MSRTITAPINETRTSFRFTSIFAEASPSKSEILSTVNRKPTTTAPIRPMMILARIPIMRSQRVLAILTLVYPVLAKILLMTTNSDPVRNPYDPLHPTTNVAMFFGREDVFAFIRQGLITGRRRQAMAIIGQHGMGKTSVL